MNIFVNGLKQEITADTTLGSLLSQLGLKQKRIAVEVNQEIVSRSRYYEHKFRANDKVEIVNAIGGG